MSKEEHNPFDSLYKTLVGTVADNSLEKDRAWLYGIIVGWDDECILELEKRFWWWTKDDSKRLKEMHEQFVKIAKQNGAKEYD